MRIVSFLQRKSRRSWRIVALIVLLGVTGCQKTLPPADPPPHQGITVRAYCPAPFAELLQSQTRVWQGRQHARVEVTPDKANTDVWLLPPAELAQWGSPDKLHPVPKELLDRASPFDWNGLLPLYREQLLLWDKTVWALPLMGEAPVCLFREDLFTSSDYQEKYRTWQTAKKIKDNTPFRAPASWQDLATLAEFFREHHPSGKPGPSLPPLPTDPRALDRLFYQVASSFARRAIRLDEPPASDHLDQVFSFQYDVTTGTPRIGERGFVAALELLKRLQACRPAQASPDPGRLRDHGGGITPARPETTRPAR
jgi:hypothetical protein